MASKSAVDRGKESPPNPEELSHLLRLLDDTSEVVRGEVGAALAAYGASLEETLDALPHPPNTAQREDVRILLAEHAGMWLRNAWEAWYAMEGDWKRLEAALSLLAQYQDGPGRQRGELGALLDGLANEFREKGAYQQGSREAIAHWQERGVRQPALDGVDLAHFLFQEKGFAGVRKNYHDHRNSNLVHVLKSKKGIPISLACVYILVGRRLGLDVGGCNWPSHFLARTQVGDTLMLVDCFNEGACTDADAFLKMQGPSGEAARTILYADTDTETMVARVLRNLVNAYQRLEWSDESNVMAELLEDLERRRQ